MLLSSIAFIFLCLVSLSCQNEESSPNCPLQKGDRGLPGHPGSPGIRGHKGDKGTQGSAGTNGDKGDRGAKGSQGLPGNQGPVGVAGPPGSQGRQGATGSQGLRGNTGIQSETGMQGPKGQKGIQGIKGENGPTGPRGRGGIDGIPGPPGHTGQAGPKGPIGDKGERGLTGHKGERGLQGIPGPDIDKEILKTLKEQIVTDLKSSLGKILKPIAYLVGDGTDWQSYSRGRVITHWSTSTSGSHPSVLQGGMTYSNGYITVPESGIYFIYFSLYSSHNNYQHPAIFVDSLRIGFSNYHHDADNKSFYVGMLWNLKKRNQLSVRAQGDGSLRYHFGHDYSYFGAWKVN
ncbi:collagen alpha-1(XIV) chain-like isoform X1 [Oscarella lobularis]|uniref:collagen alpha-1(XIV) chain-like isoform X1 n=1 Tax=Oscarella lobularis TaxID=121494 RepID=UPI003313904A